MTVDDLITQLSVLSRDHNCGNLDICVSVIGLKGFSSIAVQVIGSPMIYKEKKEPCIVIAVQREIAWADQHG